MATLSNKLVANSGKNGSSDYYCIVCDYTCCKKYNWEKHLSTNKHINATNGNNSATKNGIKMAIKPYCCENCGKEYNDRTGLWRHNKNGICTANKNNTIIENPDDKNNKLIEYLMKENKEIKEMILEILKNGTINNSHNNTNTNSHNKAFNLNLFLNETCKNAMNITDFVDSIKLQLSDLMEIGEIGYVEGISKIIVKNLNNLDETIRPVHCTDKKREIITVGECTIEVCVVRVGDVDWLSIAVEGYDRNAIQNVLKESTHHRAIQIKQLLKESLQHISSAFDESTLFIPFIGGYPRFIRHISSLSTYEEKSRLLASYCSFVGSL